MFIIFHPCVFVATQNEISWQTEIYVYDEHESRPQANLLIFLLFD